MSDVILRTENLGKLYKNRWAVQGLNLEIHRGDVFGFLGPNGAGKSTTIRMVLSLIRPTTGSVEIFGYPLAKKRELSLAKVAGIVEKPDFYLYLSAFRNMQIAGSMTLGHTPDKDRILDLLKTVDLTGREFDRVKTYSHGMKQRLGIAQALLCDPELIVLDEPTNGLDPQGMKEVRELIHRLSTERGMTVFLSSHLLNEVEQVATRMAIINKGQLIVQGSVEELLHANVGKFVFDVTPTKKGLALLRKVETIESVEATDTGIIAEMKRTDVHQVIANLVEAGCRVHSVSPQRSLEEFFLSVVEEPEANNRMQR